MSDLNLVFKYQGNSITMQCKETDIISDVFARYCFKAGLDINEVKFYANTVEVPSSNKTLFALGINNKMYHTFDVTRATGVVGA